MRPRRWTVSPQLSRRRTRASLRVARKSAVGETAPREVGDEWQVVAGDERFRSALQMQLLQPQGGIVVNVIQVEERQQTGVGSRPAEVGADVGAFQVRTEKPGGEAGGPFIEVAQDEAGCFEAGVQEQIGVDQFGAPAGAVRSRKCRGAR